MKVLALTQIYPNHANPTLGTFNFNIFKAVADRCEVRVVSPKPWWTDLRRPSDLFRVEAYDSFGLPAEYPCYWSVPRMPALHGLGMYHSLRNYVSRLRRSFPFDAILAAWGYPDAFAAQRMARDFDCPVVVRVMGTDINFLAERRLLRGQIQRALCGADAVIAVSQALADKMAALGVSRERVVVVRNAVDGTAFRINNRDEARRMLELPLEPRIICYVGRFEHEKGVDILVAALAALRHADIGEVRLVLIGAGAAEESLHQMAVRLNIEDRIAFVGKKPNNQITHWMAAADVFCLPSRDEGCPNVLLEALASGRPVVAARVGGIPEMLTEETGIMVRSEDPRALADGLAAALRRDWDPRALRAAVRSLSWDEVGARYVEIIRRAVEMRREKTAESEQPVASAPTVTRL